MAKKLSINNAYKDFFIKQVSNFRECLKENPDVYAKSSFEERYAWQLTDVQVFEKPIEVNGKLGLWNYEL